MALKRTQIGRRDSNMLALKVGALITELLGCQDLHMFLHCFSNELKKIKTGNHTYADCSYKAELANGQVQIWKIDSKGDKKRMVYAVYE